MSKHLIEDEALVGESTLPPDFNQKIEWKTYMVQLFNAKILQQTEIQAEFPAKGTSVNARGKNEPT